MPTYQYSCTDCGHFLEAVQSFSEDSLTECPQCSGRLRKLFNAVGVVFKGSGFYRTDSRNSSSAADTSSGSGTSDSGSSSSSTSSSTSSSAGEKKSTPASTGGSTSS